MNHKKPEQREGPNPAEFPIGSPESRAAARLLAGNLPINCIIVHSASRKRLQMRSGLTPTEHSHKPLGQTIFKGRTYEVYEGGKDLNNLELFFKDSDVPLQAFTLPKAIGIIEAQYLGI